MAATYSTSNLATVKQWTKTIFKEALYGNPLSGFMGTSASAPIQVIPTLMNLAGDEATVHMTPKMSTSSVVRGDGQLKGNEVDVSLFTDKITVDTVKFANVIRQKEISQQRVQLDLKAEQYDLCRNLEQELIRDDLLTALVDKTSGRTQARYRYGADESNWNSTHATAALNVDSTNDKMTLALVEAAVRKAKYTGTYKMNPAKLSYDQGFAVEGFVLLLHPRAARDLRQDPDYKTQVVYNDYLKGKAAVFQGSQYLGTYAGAIMFEMPDINNIMLETGAGAGSIDIAHNLLLGAQAAMIGWAMKPEFRLDSDDYDTNRGVALISIRGQKKIVFNSEDWATTHIFTAAVA